MGNHGKQVFAAFDSLGGFKTLPPMTEDVCREWRFDGQDVSECSLFWCEVDASVDPVMENTCQCFREELIGCDDAAEAQVVQRHIGVDSFSESELLLLADRAVVGSVSRKSIGQTSLAPIVLQEWETGNTQLSSMTQVEMVLNRISQNATCGWHELCYCSTSICTIPSTMLNMSVFNLTTRRLAPEPPRTLVPATTHFEGRQLHAVDPTTPVKSRTKVSVVFGIEVDTSVPLVGEVDYEARWSYSNSFKVNDPWAQRNLYQFCTNMPPGLHVVTSYCWIVDFRAWLVRRKMRFPVPKYLFEEVANEYLAKGKTGTHRSKHFLWLVDGEVKACEFLFEIDVDISADSQRALEHRQQWDTYIAEYNERASEDAKGAWHTSQLWVRAEAQEELVISTGTTLFIIILFAFIGMLLFTCDPILPVFVVMSTFFVVVGLCFFVIVVMKWAVGAVEVIALIVFLGYAVTYSLHVAHKYGSDEALQKTVRTDLSGPAAVRYQRARYSLQSIGLATCGSAATTFGSGTFLLFCQLNIFRKLGAVVLAVTVLSICGSFVVLVAVLLVFGPLKPGKNWLKRAQMTGAEFRPSMERLLCCGGRCRSETAEVVQFADSDRLEDVVDVGYGCALVQDELGEFRVVCPCSSPMQMPSPPEPIEAEVHVLGAAVQDPSCSGGSNARGSCFEWRESYEPHNDSGQSGFTEELAFDVGKETALEPIWSKSPVRTAGQRKRMFCNGV